ncbi:MAG: hypothetical protein K940chlam5_01284 [Candidatus Anoxychlamydiales bacterium]|uniref:Leucine-rich repeat domain-containing protein n=1 Tax=marine sediment metagenome TaxID=412755 RepID=A0A0F9GQI3_9ZZZZ|nr:hypothetical protein [Candidatus Anoxychlamydiales bacterium]
MQDFEINEYLSLRLEDERTIIYVGRMRFRQCKYLLLNIRTDEIQSLDEIESIDDAAERLDKSQEGSGPKEVEIPPEMEFWGHCSNLQVWYENDYDTRLLHINLAFSLLKKLTEMGDPLAKKVFKREIIRRYKNGTKTTREFLEIEGLLGYLILDVRLNLMLKQDNLFRLMELSEEITIESPLPIIEILLECIKIKNKKIVELDLSKFDLNEFPTSILKFKALRILSLRSNFLKEIPRRIDKLKNLKELWLSHNKLRYLPNSICRMKNLESIWASDNKLRWLPEEIGRLTKLKILQLSNNRLRILPESICELNSLNRLNLHSNYLSNLPKYLFKIKSLKHIDLRNNRLKKNPEVPKKIESLKNIEI